MMDMRIAPFYWVATAVIVGAGITGACSDVAPNNSQNHEGAPASSAGGRGGGKTDSTVGNSGVGGSPGGASNTGKSGSGGSNNRGGTVSSGGSRAADDTEQAGGASGRPTGSGGKSTPGSGGTTTAGAGGKSTPGSGGRSELDGGTMGRGGATGDSGTGNRGTGGRVTSDASANAGGSSSGTGNAQCNPADKTAAPTAVTAKTAASPTGSYKVVIEQEAGISDHTVYRPADLSAVNKLGIIAWGEGGCGKDGLMFSPFLTNFASYGFLIIADGAPNGSGSGGMTSGGAGADGTPLIKAIDWAIKENNRPCSQYYQKLDTSQISVQGQSCGGLMAYAAAGDPRVTNVVAWNSGLMAADQATYQSLHTPMAIIDGGSDDIAYKNGLNDFTNITSIPLLFANYPYGHMGAWSETNGGEFGKAGIAWLKWQMMGDESAAGKGMFLGANCGLCGDKSWTVQSKNMQ